MGERTLSLTRQPRMGASAARPRCDDRVLLVLGVRFERTTCRLRVGCSTVELPQRGVDSVGQAATAHRRFRRGPTSSPALHRVIASGPAGLTLFATAASGAFCLGLTQTPS